MKIVILLGGNEGDVLASFKSAVLLLSEKLGKTLKTSGYYESEPWGFEADNNFVNQVLEFEFDILPMDLLAVTQQIEKKLGRRHKTKEGYESRPIDIDILFMDDLVIDTPILTIPHPRLHERMFTLMPLMEFWADDVHPRLNALVSDLYQLCEDDSKIVRLIV